MMFAVRQAFLSFVVAAVSLSTTFGTSQPSVLIVIADDQGWGDLSCHGNSNLATPNLDALKQQGASFERFYVQPVCSPTRAELLTACYAPRVGVTGVTAGGERLDVDVPTIADAFRAAGYATAAFGKWHNGTQAPYHPLCRGFDSFYGFTSGHWANYFAPMLDRDGTITHGRGYLTDDITNEVIQFVERHHESPFFALVAFNTPHSPMQVPDRWWEPHATQELAERGTKVEKENIQHTRAALAMCENIDWNMGRVLETLDELGIDDNTIVVYLSDNGPNGHRYNNGLRGIKGSTDEGGTRSPLFVRWPNAIKPGHTVVDVAGVIDLAPTLAELTGIDLLHGPQIDGASLAPMLRGKKPQPEGRMLFSHWGGRTAVRTGSWTLDAQGRLYDLAADPGQTTDVADANPAKAKELSEAVARWRREALDTKTTQRPFTVGHPALTTTHLPARDATTVGNLRRSSRHFNCTYFSNWTSTDDAIVWDVEIVTAGRYRATAYYTCPESDAGSLVELRLGEQFCQAKVSPGFDAPLFAAMQDRVPRTEGDIKEFRTLDLGELNLSAGRGDLTLQAVDIAVQCVMDLRLLLLTRVD